MMELMFYFMIVFWVGIFIFGLYTKSPIIVVFVGMLFTLSGAMLETEFITIDDEQNSARISDVDANTIDINYGFLQRTPSNDEGLGLIADVLFYGGFAVMALSLGLFIYKWQFKEEDDIIRGA